MDSTLPIIMAVILVGWAFLTLLGSEFARRLQSQRAAMVGASASPPPPIQQRLAVAKPTPPIAIKTATAVGSKTPTATKAAPPKKK